MIRPSGIITAALLACSINASAETLQNLEADSITNMSKERMEAIEKEVRRREYRQKYGGYAPKDEFSISSAPLIAFGLISMTEKKQFRTAHEKFIPFYKNGLDDYMQFAPLAVSTVLKVAGYEGRSNFWRYVASAGASYVVMAALVNGLKYSVRQMRPDGSTPNSFPSGHTATAFTAATILHKEYGLTRSPWWSVLGYTTATATGIMRTLNNRHWISDVLVGAGIGIISTDIGYTLVDLILKNKGIKRQPREHRADLIHNPSFFRLSLGMQTFNDLRLPASTTYNSVMQVWDNTGASKGDNYYTVVRNGNPFRIADADGAKTPTYKHYAGGKPAFEEGQAPTIHTSLGTTVGAEAAYFFNPYVGVGLRGRITTASVYADGLYCYDAGGLLTGNDGQRLSGYTSAGDVWSVADIGLGVYGSYPITPRQSIGAKVLYGRRFYGELDLQASYEVNYRVSGENKVDTDIMYGDNLNVAKTNADEVSVGVSYTYAAGNGMALTGFVDYDYCKPEYNITYTPYNTSAQDMILTSANFKHKQKMHSFTIGASMVVMF